MPEGCIAVTDLDAIFDRRSDESNLHGFIRFHRPHEMHLIPTVQSATSRRSGISIIANGEAVDAIGDSGSSTNIVDEAFAHKRGWEVHSQPSFMTLGDKSTLFSAGTVRIKTAFADAPGQRRTAVARVVRDFPFDVLLGRPFLRATSTLTKFFYRFKTCVFPRLTPRMSFNFVDTMDELELDLLSVQLPGGKENAMLDTGANRNIADYDWVVRRGLHLRTEDDFRGWITFPSGERKATVGQVHTMMTLQDGRKVPLTLEVLEDCALPLVLGEEVIFQFRLFEVDCEINPTYHTVSALDEVLHMDYMPWYHNIVQKAKRKFRKQTVGLSHTDMDESEELERQWQWDRLHGYGKSANVETWMEEYYRREDHQKALYPTVDIKGTLLIRYVSYK
ncbi:hypothetical protein SLS60_005913 [Paraconiothyrium brasiliense]|uniref:Peptidase A2 domain-containing protein n=1 Tax=Paraconiothyrium brasiliense TaxID=300254 RepID=A0ABR3RDN9_9PLEO